MNESSLNEITALIAEVSDIYAARFGIERDDNWYLFKLHEEIGELTKAYVNFKGMGKSTPENATNLLEEEVADVLAHILLFAKAMGIDAQSALKAKWLKYLDI